MTRGFRLWTREVLSDLSYGLWCFGEALGNFETGKTKVAEPKLDFFLQALGKVRIVTVAKGT